MEGAAAVAISSFLNMKDKIKHLNNIVILICGGNIGNKTLKSIL